MPDVRVVWMMTPLLAKPLVCLVNVMGLYHYESIVETTVCRRKMSISSSLLTPVSKWANVPYWPGPAIRSIEICTSPMAAYWF